MLSRVGGPTTREGSVIEDVRPFEDAPDGFVVLHAVGTKVAAACRCSECGYGVAVFRTLPRCPMCGGESWEEEAAHPVGHTVAEL
jgi:hypothetical protein